MLRPKHTIKHIQYGTEEYRSEIALRQRILREPLGLAYTEEQLYAEREEIRFGLFIADELRGCLLLKRVDGTTLQMRQVAIDASLQGKGLGRALVVEAERYAFENGYKNIILHARETVIPFYEKSGYCCISGQYIEVGIPHRTMSKSIS
jgi:predicted GNAT family N-acyltransferase